jgi:hypothetical protein
MKKLRIDLKDFNIDLTSGETYTIEIEENFVIDPEASLKSSTESFEYTVPDVGPTLIDTNPDLGDTNVYIANIQFTFNERIRLKPGNFYLYEDGSPDTLILTIPTSNSKISVAENQITVDVSGYLNSETTYYIISDSNIIENLIGIETGVTSEDIVKWTTGLIQPAPINVSFSLTLDSDISQVESREYFSNQRNNIFNINSLQISYNSNDVNESVFSLVLSLDNGEFWTYGTTPNNIITLSGSKSYINGLIDDYGYYPTKNSNTTDNLNVRLYKDDYLLENKNIDINYIGEGSILDEPWFENSSGSVSWDYEYVKYFNNMSVLVVGSGGGGTRNGGGGGDVVITELTPLASINPNNSYAYTVGLGGAAGSNQSGVASNGNSSSIFGITAAGGTGANFLNSGYTPGKSINRQTFDGAYIVTDLSPNANNYLLAYEGDLIIGASGGGSGGNASNHTSKLYYFTYNGNTYSSYRVGYVGNWNGYTGYGNEQLLMAAGSWYLNNPDTTPVAMSSWGGNGTEWNWSGVTQYGAGGMGSTWYDLDGSQSQPNATGGVKLVRGGFYRDGSNFGAGGNGFIYKAGTVSIAGQPSNQALGYNGNPGIIKIKFYN